MSIEVKLGRRTRDGKQRPIALGDAGQYALPHGCTQTGDGLWLTTLVVIRRPQGQVVPEKLHDECGVFVRILSNIVKFCDCIFECCASHFARLIWLAQHLVLEHREVQGKAKTNWV